MTEKYDKFDEDEDENELDNSDETDRDENDEDEEGGEEEDGEVVDDDDDDYDDDDDDGDVGDDDDDDDENENEYNLDIDDDYVSDNNDNYDNDSDPDIKRESIFESFYKKFHDLFNHKPTKHRLIDEQLGKRNLFFPFGRNVSIFSCPTLIFPSTDPNLCRATQMHNFFFSLPSIRFTHIYINMLPNLRYTI